MGVDTKMSLNQKRPPIKFSVLGKLKNKNYFEIYLVVFFFVFLRSAVELVRLVGVCAADFDMLYTLLRLPPLGGKEQRRRETET